MSRLDRHTWNVETEPGQKRIVFAVSYVSPGGTKKPEREVLERHYNVYPEDRNEAEVTVVYSGMPAQFRDALSVRTETDCSRFLDLLRKTGSL